MAYQLRDLADIVQMVVDELKLDPNNAAEIARIKRDVNLVYLDEVVPFIRWKWLTGHTKVQHKAFYGSGTAALTPGYSTVTLSVAPPISLAGYQIALENFEEAYEVLSHIAGSNSLTLTTTYTGSLVTDAQFKAWEERLTLPVDLAETISARHDFMSEPMTAVGLQELRRLQVKGGRQRARPSVYATHEFSSGDDSTRIRALRVYPAISDFITTISIDYKREVASLDLDGDEPLMPIDDRVVLVYGALQRAWRRARNPDEAKNNEALYEKKLARMAGKVEDGFDKPKLTTSSEYMANKRRRYVSRLGSTPNMSGGGYNAPTYAKDIQIEGGKVTADISVNPSITIDGRDLSADGAALDEHLAATADAHPATAVSTTDLPFDNVQSVLVNHEARISDALTNTAFLDHLNDTTDAHMASAIGFAPTADTTSTDVQAAITEVQVDAKAANTEIAAHEANVSNPHAVTKAQVGLGSADNTSDVNKPVSTAQAAADAAVQAFAIQRANHTGTQVASTISDFSTAADARITAQKGAALGLAPLDGSSLIPAAYLPSYVDDVLEYANLAALPGTGETGKIYVTLDTNKTYRWSGSVYVEISASPGSTDAVTEGSTNLYFTAARVLAVLLAGLSTATATAITTADSVLTALGKLQAQITANIASIALKANAANPSLTGAITLAETTTPAAPSAGSLKLYAKSDDKIYYQTSAGTESAVGSGGGSQATPLNKLIANPSAEQDTSGWATYADAAATSPVDGTGGSPTLTWTRSTSSPLDDTAHFLLTKPASNIQGQGVAATPITVPTSYQGRVLQGSFSCQVLTGTYADGDAQLFWYDITNSTLVYMTEGQSILNATSSQDQLFRFQMPYNCSSGRFIIHWAGTSAGALTMAFDDFSIGKQLSPRGVPVTDWVAYTPTLTGFGTVSGLSALSRRVGDTLEVKASFVTGTVTGTAATMTLGFGGSNSNVTIASSLASAQLVGQAEYSTNNTILFGGTILASPSTGLVSFARVSSTTSGLAAAAGSAVVASSAAVSLFFSVPILGWSSSSAMSADVSGRFIEAIYAISADKTPGTGQLNYDTLVKDTAGAVTTGASWKFTAPEYGIYTVVGNSNISAAGGGSLVLNKNGSAYAAVTALAAAEANLTRSWGCEVELSAGDYIDLRPNTTGSTFQLAAGTPSQFNRIYISKKATSGQQIAATERICATYGLTTLQAVSANAIIKYDTKVEDTHGLFNTTTGLLTSNFNGKLIIEAVTCLSSAGASTYIKKNGVAGGYINTTPVANFAASGTIEILVSVGDTVGLYSDSGVNASAASVLGFLNQVTFKRAT